MKNQIKNTDNLLNEIESFRNKTNNEINKELSRYYDGFDLSILTHMAALYLSIELEGISDTGAINGNIMAVEDILWYLHEKYTIEIVCDDIIECMKKLYGVEEGDCIKELITLIGNSKQRNCMGLYFFEAAEKTKSDTRYK